MTSDEISKKWMFVVSTLGGNGEHKVLVNSDDSTADYLLEKIDNDKSAIKFVDQGDGTVKLFLNTQGQEGSTDTSKLLRPIFPYTLQNCDSEVTVHGDNTKQYHFVFPVTLPHGVIRGFELLASSESEFNKVNSVQIAVIGSPTNTIKNGEAEFAGEWYTSGASDAGRVSNCVFLRSDRYYDADYNEYTANGNGRRKGDGKSFMMKNAARMNIQNSNYKFHFIALAIWVKEGSDAKFIGRNASSTLDNIGCEKDAYFMGEDTMHNMFSEWSLINPTDYKVTSSFQKTDLVVPFPFVALYQERG